MNRGREMMYLTDRVAAYLKAGYTIKMESGARYRGCACDGNNPACARCGGTGFHEEIDPARKRAEAEMPIGPIDHA